MQVINGEKMIKETFKDSKKSEENVHFIHSYPNGTKTIEITGDKTSGEYIMKIINKKKNIKKKYKINQKQYDQVMKSIKEH